MASAAQRLAMVRLLVDGDPRFDVDAIEIDRGGLSYTVDTLTALSGPAPGRRSCSCLVGADVIQSFAKWREPQRIAELATLVVLQTGGRWRRRRICASVPGAPRPARVAARRRLVHGDPRAGAGGQVDPGIRAGRGGRATSRQSGLYR